MSAGSIIIEMLLKTATFETDTKRAEKRLRELKKEAEELGRGIGLAFAAVGAASVLLVKHAIDAADATGKLAQKTGTTVEELSALTFAARLADVSQEDLGAALVKLTKNMSDAADGSGEAVKGFEALGISVKNADGSLKGSDQVLTEIAEKFASFKDGAEKTALAVNLFGRSGAQLIPMLNAGASGLQEMKEEARKLGVVLGTETAKSAEAFNDNLTRLGQSVSGIANRAAQDLLPALNGVSDALVELAKNEEFIATTTAIVKGAIDGLIVVFQTIAIVASDVGFVFLGVGREIGAVAAQIAALGAAARSGDLTGFRAISDAVKADGERARAELDKFQARIMSIGQLGPDRTTGDFSRADRGGAKRAAPRMAGDSGAGKVSEAQRYLDALEKQFEKTLDLTLAEQALIDIRKGMKGLTPALEQQILAQAKLTDASIAHEKALKSEKKAREDIEKMIDSATEAARVELATIHAANDALQIEIDKLGADEVARAAIDNAITQSLITRKEEVLLMRENAGALDDETNAIRAQIAALKEKQLLTTKRADIENFQGVQKNAEEIFEKWKKQTEEMSEFAKQASANIQDALGETMLRTLKGDFASIGQLWSDLILKMISQAIAARLNEKLFGKDGLSGLLGPALNAIFGGTGGGGPVTDNGAVNNPSAYTTASAGRDMPMSMGKGGGVSVVNHNQFGSDISRNELANWGEAIKEQTKADIYRSMRSRGQFATS